MCPCLDRIYRLCSPGQIRPRQSFHCQSRPPCDQLARSGALVVLVAVQLSVPGLYLPPVFNSVCVRYPPPPDDHFAPGPNCRVTVTTLGRVGILVVVQSSVLGLYLPPVLKGVKRNSLPPPQTIISYPSTPRCDRLGHQAGQR